jgi:hypothetical protein
MAVPLSGRAGRLDRRDAVAFEEPVRHAPEGIAVIVNK